MRDTQRPELGVIGGSGLYALAGLTDVEAVAIETPFGAPSEQPRVGTLGGQRVAFPGLALPDVGREPDGRRVGGERSEQAAGFDLWKLFGVAD